MTAVERQTCGRGNIDQCWVPELVSLSVLVCVSHNCVCAGLCLSRLCLCCVCVSSCWGSGPPLPGASVCLSDVGPCGTSPAPLSCRLAPLPPPRVLAPARCPALKPKPPSSAAIPAGEALNWGPELCLEPGSPEAALSVSLPRRGLKHSSLPQSSLPQSSLSHSSLPQSSLPLCLPMGQSQSSLFPCLTLGKNRSHLP